MRALSSPVAFRIGLTATALNRTYPGPILPYIPLPSSRADSCREGVMFFIPLIRPIRSLVPVTSRKERIGPSFRFMVISPQRVNMIGKISRIRKSCAQTGNIADCRGTGKKTIGCTAAGDETGHAAQFDYALCAFYGNEKSRIGGGVIADLGAKLPLCCAIPPSGTRTDP